jgi:hypothetical protein
VITMRVSDDSAVNRPPGIDVEVTRLAVEAAVGQGKKGHVGR